MQKSNIYKISHAAIFSIQKGGYLRPILLEYLKKIVCAVQKNDEFCNVCDFCRKIDNDSYYDLMKIDFKQKGTNKDDIFEIKNRFSNNGLEKINKKIYLINNIELATLQVFNSLLKFLESPPTNTYAILVTNNFLSLPPTIISRCKLFNITNHSDIWLKISVDNNLLKEDVFCLKEMFWSADDAIIALEDGTFTDLKNFAKSMLTIKINDIREVKMNLENFKKKTYYEIEKIISCMLILADKSLKSSFLDLILDIKFNPPRALIFNKLLGIINKNELW